jgi:hypothetical protein
MHDEGEQHAQRQRDDHDQRRCAGAAGTRAHQRDDDRTPRAACRVRCRWRAGSGPSGRRRDDLHALRQAGRSSSSLAFTASIDSQRVLAERMTTMPPRRPRPRRPARRCRGASSGPSCDAGHVAQRTGVPAGRAQRGRSMSSSAAQVAAAAHHVLGLGHLEHAAADLAVGARIASPRASSGCRRRAAVPGRHHLVLLHHAADGGDLGHARRLGSS